MVRLIIRTLLLSLTLQLCAKCPEPPPTTAYGNPPVNSYALKNRVALFGDFLYWIPYEEGLEYVFKVGDSVTFPTGSATHGSYHEIPSEWHPGFRVGMDTHLVHDQWDLGVYWSSFTSKINDSVHAAPLADGSNPLIPLLIDMDTLGAILNFAVEQAKGSWQMEYSTLDFFLTRPYLLSTSLSIAPLYGLKAAWINQDLYFQYRSNGTITASTYIENDNASVGPTVGTTLSWWLVDNLKLFGQLAGGLLFNSLNFKQIQVSTANSNGDNRINLQQRNYGVVPTASTSLGLSWGTCLNEGHNFFEIGVSYQLQIWWRQLHTRLEYDQVPDSQTRSLDTLGALALMGGAFRAQLAF